MRVKASFVGRELSKNRLCKQLGPFQLASSHQLEATRRGPHQYSSMPPRVPQSFWKEYEQTLDQARTQRQEAWTRYREHAFRERRQLKQKYRRQRAVLGTLPVSSRDRKRLLQQLALRQTIEGRTLKRRLAIQRTATQKTLASRNLASLRRKLRRSRRRACDSPGEATRAEARFAGSR